MQVILWMLGFVALIGFLVLLKSKMHLSFSIRVLIALLLGAAFGLALFFLAEKTVNQEVRRWVSLVGFGYVDLLRMLIIPLVPTSIIAGLIKLSNTSELKQMGVRTIGIFLFTATVAGIIGLLVGNIFSVGTGMAIGDLAAREASTVTNLFSQFRNFIPSNFVKSAAETNMIPLVVFSIFIGVSAIMVKTKKPEAVKPFQDILESF
ncbi:MAG: cation:dicarboxylase symporter family transporter, partial [Sphaerochaeta sp.]|nr:cation:dicarboxylase symporter family transporter [Sphaerochaeta sp.]